MQTFAFDGGDMGPAPLQNGDHNEVFEGTVPMACNSNIKGDAAKADAAFKEVVDSVQNAVQNTDGSKNDGGDSKCDDSSITASLVDNRSIAADRLIPLVETMVEEDDVSVLEDDTSILVETVLEEDDVSTGGLLVNPPLAPPDQGENFTVTGSKAHLQQLSLIHI